MNSDELNAATREELEARRDELEQIPNVDKMYPEGAELQNIKQRLDPDYDPPVWRGFGPGFQ